MQELRAGAARVLVQEKLSPHQIGVKALSCQGRSCEIALQLPPFVEASVKRDSTVAAELMEALRAEYGKQGARVALTQLDHAREGMSISFQVEATAEKGRYLTDSEIAQLRAETIEAYLKSQKK